jgi:ribosomal protein S15P/S13E
MAVNGLFLNLLRTVAVAAVVGMATAIWNMNSQLAVLQERIANVLQHSDKKDEEFERRTQRIEQRLDELRR